MILDPRAALYVLPGAGMEEDFSMSRRCELTAKGPLVGHKVSHSNIKTKRRFLPNLVNVTFISDALGRNVRLRVSTNALKSVDHNGGLDGYLLESQGRRAVAPRTRSEARDPEEGRQAGVRQEGELKLSFSRGIRILNGWVERPGRFCMAEPAQTKSRKTTPCTVGARWLYPGKMPRRRGSSPR